MDPEIIEQLDAIIATIPFSREKVCRKCHSSSTTGLAVEMRGCPQCRVRRLGAGNCMVCGGPTVVIIASPRVCPLCEEGELVAGDVSTCPYCLRIILRERLRKHLFRFHPGVLNL